MATPGEFSTYQFFPNGHYEELCRFVSAEEAIETAKMVIRSVGGQIGTTKQVIITDGWDSCVFEWKHGEGIVWPEELKGFNYESR